MTRPSLIIVIGAFAQIAQILILRELLDVVRGGELLIGLILAATLGWTALGTFYSSRRGEALKNSVSPTADPRELDSLTPSIVPALAALLGPLLAGQIVLARLFAGAGMLVPNLGGSALAAILLPAPSSFLCGVMLGKFLRSRDKTEAASFYQAESWGAVLGGLLFTFLLLHFVSPIHGALLSGAVVTMVVLLVARASTARVTAVVFTVLAAAFLPLDDWSLRLRWGQALAGFSLLESRETPTGRVAALASPDRAQTAFFHDAALVATVEPRATPTDTRQLADFLACQHSQPQNILLIGDTLGGLPVQLLRHQPRRVDVCELEPALFDLAKRHLAPPDQRIHALRTDGRRLLTRTQPQSYDLIAVAPGQPDSFFANRYCTREFFREAKRALAADGVLAVSVPDYGSAPEYHSGTLAARDATVWRALRLEFAEVRAAPINGCLFVASDNVASVTLDPTQLAARLAQRPDAVPVLMVDSNQVRIAEADYFTTLFGGVLAMRSALDGPAEQPLIRSLEAALAAAPARVNSDEQPVAVTASFALFAQLVGSPAGEWMGQWLVWGPVLLAVVVALGIRLQTQCAVGVSPADQALVPAGKMPAALLFVAFATGAFGMAVEVALLASYQNVRGFLYSEIGLLLAACMAGLALGARWGGRTRHPRRALVTVLSLMVLLAAVLPWIVRGLAMLRQDGLAASGFWGLTIVSGWLVGSVFPMLTAQGPHRAASIYAADLAGAAVGAALCGTLWVPLVGLTSSILALALVLVTALVTIRNRRETPRQLT